MKSKTLYLIIKISALLVILLVAVFVFYQFFLKNSIIQNFEESENIEGGVNSLSSSQAQQLELDGYESVEHKILNENTVNYCIGKKILAEPEFIRTISLIDQRLSEHTQDSQMSFHFKNISNCLEIKYTKTNHDLEGYFSFSDTDSGEGRLSIYVSSDYKHESDYLTAMLIMHELTHAFFFYSSDVKQLSINECQRLGDECDMQKLENLFGNFGKKIACYTEEASAFIYESILFDSFNQNEKLSIISRSIYFPDIGEIDSFNYMLNMRLQAAAECGNSSGQVDSVDCLIDVFENDIRTNPYYQEQCKN